jgi:serine/threonine-protein kinase HipA
LEELWKRVVFNIAISNCDDHLRNHGFILTSHGWILSPVFDLTPNPNGLGLKLNINEDDNSLNYQLAIDTASYYGITKDDAFDLVKRCKKLILRLASDSYYLGISRAEQEQIAPAFTQ